MKKRIAISLITLLLSIYNVNANDGLISIFPVDGSSLGKAEAVTASIDNASALYYNPAGLGKVNSISANYSYLNYIFDQQFHNITGAYRLSGIGVIGIGMNTIQDEGFKLTTPTGESDVLLESSSWSFNAGYCYEMNNNLLIGASIKYLHDSYTVNQEELLSSGFGISLGVIKDNIFIDDLALSLVAKNFGLKGDYENGTKGSMPYEITAGSSYNLNIDRVLEAIKTITINGDVSINGYQRSGFRLGTETKFKGLPSNLNVFFRLGIQLPALIKNNFISGLFTGTGIKWNNYSFDYAFTYAGEDLGTINFLTLSVDM